MKKRKTIFLQLLFAMLFFSSMTFCAKSDEKSDENGSDSDASEYGYMKADLTMPDGSKVDYYIDFEDIIIRPWMEESDRNENIKFIFVRTDVGYYNADNIINFTLEFDGKKGEVVATEDINLEVIFEREIDDETYHYTGRISLYIDDEQEELSFDVKKISDTWLTATFSGNLYADAEDSDDVIVIKNGKIDCALR